jgi:hypothetical protein
MKELQEKLWKWQTDTFGEPSKDFQKYMSMRIIEEIGVLFHHLLERDQGISKKENHIVGVYDAIGNISIYILNLLSYLGYVIDKELPLQTPKKVAGNKLLRKTNNYTRVLCNITSYASDLMALEQHNNAESSIHHSMILFLTLADFCSFEIIDYIQCVEDAAFYVMNAKE